jgi:Uncharacterised nucleotidyltransferase
MNRRLAEAVVATFRDDDEGIARRRLAGFRVHDWRRSLHWLDASGLALYFLDRLKSLGLEQDLPPEILAGLRSRLTDNRQRTADLFAELLRINQALQAAGLRYVNLKGFTLVPNYCPDPSLRCQFDLDFLVSSPDALPCRAVLEATGYVLAGSSENVLEFKAGYQQPSSINDLYKTRSQRAVEVHFVPTSAEAVSLKAGPLARCRKQVWNGIVFPILCDTDMFLLQARHVLRHVKSEWTRISWLLEFRTFVLSRHTDVNFWQEVDRQATATLDGPLSIGVAIWLAREAFGDFAPRALTDWSLDTIPTQVRLWLECYGRKVLLSDFPGTKLYLLLDSELSPNKKAGNKASLKRVFPLHRPPRITFASGKGIGQKTRKALAEAMYMLFRLRFHITEGSRYMLEAQRWKRRVQASGWSANQLCLPGVGGGAAEY